MQLAVTAQGAGIQAGKRVVDPGVDGLITGHTGPGAFTALAAGRVKIYTGSVAQRGIQVIAGAPADAPERIVGDYLAARLEAGPNTCDH